MNSEVTYIHDVVYQSLCHFISLRAMQLLSQLSEPVNDFPIGALHIPEDLLVELKQRVSRHWGVAALHFRILLLHLYYFRLFGYPC